MINSRPHTHLMLKNLGVGWGEVGYDSNDHSKTMFPHLVERKRNGVA